MEVTILHRLHMSLVGYTKFMLLIILAFFLLLYGGWKVKNKQATPLEYLLNDGLNPKGGSSKVDKVLLP